MGLCMDSSDWLQVFGGHHDHEIGMDSSSSPSGDMMTCTTRPLMERRLRPQQDQSIKCPRCDSTHTKFCYYNNYSLSQPRYFCKTCRRYWTKGGTLRNIPVGGGCRKNKRAVIKRSNDQPHLNPNHPNFLTQPAGTDLQLSFPDVGNSLFNSNLMEMNYSSMSGLDNLQGLWSTYDGSYGPLMDTSQRFMLTFEGSDDSNAFEMKPDSKVLSLDWKDHGCSQNGNGLRSWQTEIDSYGSSATAPLI